MNRLPFLLATTVFLLHVAGNPSAAHAQFGNPYDQEVVAATNVLVQTNSMPSGIPQKLLAEAQAIAIVPNMVRGAFVVGVQHGRGVLVMRGPQRA